MMTATQEKTWINEKEYLVGERISLIFRLWIYVYLSQRFIHIFLSSFCFLLVFFWYLPAMALDTYFEIQPSYLQEENFLDLQEYRFRKLQEKKWQESLIGLRASGGSLGLDLLYTEFDLKYWDPISTNVELGLHAKQKEWFEIQPLRYLIEMQLGFLKPLYISLVGMPEYDKRQVDQGIAITWGRRTQNYLRFQHLAQNLYYNEKNLYDQSYYDPHPIEELWEGAWEYHSWKFRFSSRKTSPSTLIFPEEGLRFSQDDQEQNAVLNFYYGEGKLASFTVEQLEIQRKQTTDNPTNLKKNRAQTIQYFGSDLYWLHPVNLNYHGTIGIRFDTFTNEFREAHGTLKSQNFLLQTFQLYGIILQTEYLDHAWEYGLYIGNSLKRVNYLEPKKTDLDHPSFEAAFRLSYELKGENSALMGSSTWNLDALLQDFWDGGHISYQRTF